MYGRGAVSTVITGSTATGSGIAVLPYAAGNSLGTVLAYTAIFIGVAILASQLAVRVLRKKYQK